MLVHRRLWSWSRGHPSCHTFWETNTYLFRFTLCLTAVPIHLTVFSNRYQTAVVHNQSRHHGRSKQRVLGQMRTRVYKGPAAYINRTKGKNEDQITKHWGYPNSVSVAKTEQPSSNLFSWWTGCFFLAISSSYASPSIIRSWTKLNVGPSVEQPSLFCIWWKWSRGYIPWKVSPGCE